MLGGVALAVALCGGAALRHHVASTLDIAAGQSKAARAALSQALHDAEQALRVAESATQEAQRSRRERDAAKHRADSAAAVAAGDRAQFAAFAAAAPDTCRDLVRAAEAALVAKDTVEAHLRGALAASETEAAQILLARDSLRAALAKVIPAGATLVSADAKLERAARPSLFTRILPRPGIGAAAGFDALGHPRIIIGVTFGWPF